MNGIVDIHQIRTFRSRGIILPDDISAQLSPTCLPQRLRVAYRIISRCLLKTVRDLTPITLENHPAAGFLCVCFPPILRAQSSRIYILLPIGILHTAISQILTRPRGQRLSLPVHHRVEYSRQVTPAHVLSSQGFLLSRHSIVD